MQQEVKVIFEGQKEIINAINSESEIVELLGLPSEKCALMGTTIKLGKKLGAGNYGAVFLIEFPGMGEKLYVVKRSNLALSTFTNTQEKLEKILDSNGFSWDSIKDWQSQETIDKWENANHYDKITVVIPPNMCLRLQDKDRIFPRIPKNTKYECDIEVRTDDIIVPKGSYICKDQSFSETAIAVYCGTLYRDETSINFFNTYTMFTCLKGKGWMGTMDYNQYTFMDKIDGDLAQYTQCITWDQYAEDNKRISPDITDGIFVQTMFAIACYQHHFKISHNDLHTGNVFVEFVTDKTKYGGRKVKECDYYHYYIEGRDIYIPAIPILAKIGDFGLSTKFSKPIIGYEEVMEDGMNTHDGTGAWIPTVYIPQYDSFFFTCYYTHKVVKNELYGNLTPLLRDSIKYMCPQLPFEGHDKNKRVRNILVKEGYAKETNLRPVLEKLVSIRDAKDTLLGPIFNKYHEEPPKGSVVMTMGII